VAHACNLATQEAEIRRIEVRSQSAQIVHETLSRKNPSQKIAGGVAQGVSPEFKPQYGKKQKKLNASGFLMVDIENLRNKRNTLEPKKYIRQINKFQACEFLLPTITYL
jgi:hypothetical protein